VTRPRLLDLFCGAGGAAMGYHRAGFDIVGVDIKPQPNYPFEFHQADAMTFPLTGFNAIHASPPCQAFTAARVIHNREHSDLLTPTRERLEASGLPWVIENVPGAPMRADVVLCGSVFGDPRLKRHRWFEFFKPPTHMMHPCSHGRQIVSVFGHGGHVYHGVAEWREVMGIDWMTRDELAQAIPPAYTEWIGAQLLTHITPKTAA
jgi:DNA (cytosine-5)-methyltransferase 1